MLRKRNVTPQTTRAMLADRKLSWRAKGILMYLAESADDVPSLNDLDGIGAEGIGAIRSALSNAEENGYLIRERLRGEHGMLSGALWVVEFGQEN